MKTFAMKPTLYAAILAPLLIGLNPALASLSYIGTGYVELSTAQNSPSYYGVADSGGSSLGNIVTINYGQTLYLGGQIQTYPQEVGVSAYLNYQINGGGYTGISLPYYQNYVNNNEWDSNGNINGSHNFTSINIDAANLAPGTYTVDLYFTGADGSGSINSAGSNFQFTVVPEPINIALGCLGGVFAAAGVIRFLNSHRFNFASNRPA